MADNETMIPEISMEVEVSNMTQTAVDPTLSVAGMAADAKATGDAIADLAADVSGIFSNLYPVGSVYISVASSLPAIISAIGTWTEIAIPMTWGDIKTGTRNYSETDNEFVPGNMHFWLRTS